MGSRTEYWDDPQAPVPNSLVPACGVLALDEDGRLLLQRRRDTGQWALPMGQMELGESPSACAVRETLEETGVLVRPAGILGIFSDPRHIIAYGDGEVRWVTAAELSELDIHPTQWRQLRHYLQRAYPHFD